MLEQKEKLYREASVAYAKGEPIMTNEEFDTLELELLELGSSLPNKVSEDFEHLEEEDGGVITDYQTFSIKAVKTLKEAELYFKKHRDEEFTATLKLDGVCAKTVFDGGKFVATSRNRESRQSIDYTRSLAEVLPDLTHLNGLSVTGEVYVNEADLALLRDTYDKDKYVLPRSAAISMLRKYDLHKEHIGMLNFRAFATNNIMTTHEEELKWLQSLGFQTPKCVVFKIDWSMDFETQINKIMEEADTGEPSDGIVIQVNSRQFSSEATGKYLDSQIALKFGKWGGDVFEGTVVGLEYTRAKGNKGCVLLIEPITLPDGAKQTRINAYNPGILERLNVTKGSKIKFRRVSNNMCNLIY